MPRTRSLTYSHILPTHPLAPARPTDGQGFAYEDDDIIRVGDPNVKTLRTVFFPHKKLNHFRHLGVSVGDTKKRQTFGATPLRSLKDRAAAADGFQPRWFMMQSSAAELVAEALERRGQWRSFSPEHR